MFSKKTAFTLIEIIVVLVIIGVVIVLEMNILQGQLNQYSAPYYNAYNTLSKAAYNVQADIYCPDNTKPAGERICPNGPRDFPTNSIGLCNRLKEFINTAPNHGNCNNTAINDNTSDGDQFDDNHLKFISTNSFRYYITELKMIDCANAAGSTNRQLCAGSSRSVNYFVVYVDINGEKNPNRVGMDLETDEIYPDIVPFAVTTMGEVVPMGYPIYSTLYLTAKIKYPQIERRGDDGGVSGFFERRNSASMDYFSAVIGAWGGGFNSEIADSILFTERMNNTFPGKSFYLNKRVTEYEKDANNRYSVVSDGNRLGIHYDDTTEPNENTRRCVAGTFDCEVIVDSTLDKRY